MHTHRPYNIPISQIVLFQGRFLFLYYHSYYPCSESAHIFCTSGPPLKCIPRRRRSTQTSAKAGDPPNAQGHSNNKTSWLYVSIPQNLFSVSKNPFCCVFSEMNFRHVANQSILPKNDVPTTLPPFFGWNSTNPHRSTKEEKKTLQAPPSTSPKASMQLSHCASSNKVSNRRTFTWTEKNGLDSIEWIIWAK